MGTNSDTLPSISSTKYSLDTQPVKTIIDFLTWYKNHQNIQEGLVNNIRPDTYDSHANINIYDSTTFYSVNFNATDKYLKKLESTGYISDNYLSKWREYFKKCDKHFHENPMNDGPPTGFEYDFVMLSQYDDDLNNLEKSKINSQFITNNNATINLYFESGHKRIYKLIKQINKWVIDDIQLEE